MGTHSHISNSLYYVRATITVKIRNFYRLINIYSSQHLVCIEMEIHNARVFRRVSRRKPYSNLCLCSIWQRAAFGRHYCLKCNSTYQLTDIHFELANKIKHLVNRPLIPSSCIFYSNRPY